MDTAYDAILARVKPGAVLRTPDAKTGKPFTVGAVDAEGVSIRTSTGGHVRISLFAFEVAAKYLSDRGHRGDNWLKVSDEEFQGLLSLENDRVRAGSYLLAVLAAAGVVEVDGGRPNRVRVR
jgi:hypothetical protein